MRSTLSLSNYKLLLVAFVGVTMSDETSAPKILEGNASLALRLYEVLSRKPGNVFFSPLSLHLVLSMVYQGAKEQTAQTMSEILQIPDPESTAVAYKSIINSLKDLGVVALDLANKVYVRKEERFLEKFEKDVREYFDSEVEVLDFKQKKETVSRINEWVEKKTEKRIQELVNEGMFDEETALVLVNAVYLSAVWKNTFSEKETRNGTFHLDCENTVQVPMMRSDRKIAYYKYDEQLEAEILALPFKGNAELVIVLPKEKNGIANLEKKLASTNLKDVLQGLAVAKVDLTLPKFKIGTTMELDDVVKELGLGLIYDEDKANFRGMIQLQPDDKFCVDTIIQKAFIDVNEKGVEAAAASAALMRKKMSGLICDNFVKIEVDHPAIFMVVANEEGRSYILFFGRLSHPTY